MWISGVVRGHLCGRCVTHESERPASDRRGEDPVEKVEGPLMSERRGIGLEDRLPFPRKAVVRIRIVEDFDLGTICQRLFDFRNRFLGHVFVTTAEMKQERRLYFRGFFEAALDPHAVI